MSNQGFPFEGKDQRLIGGVFAKICSALSWKSSKQPPSLILSAFGFKLYVPLWWNDKFLMLRAGWHFDMTNQAYILGFALKVTDVALLY